VWAPALVGWVGGSNWRVSFSGGAAPAVGWFPLAPREVFVPSYSVSPTYVRQVNITHVTSINNITNVNGFAQLPPQAHYQNRDLRNAVTVVPHAEFEHGRRSVPVTSLPRMIDPRQLQQAPTSATAALPRDQHFQRDPMNVPRERRYLQQSQPQPQQQQQQPLQQQAQPVQPQAIQRQPVPLQQVAPQSLPTAPTPPRDWRIQQRQEASQGNLDAAQPQRRMIPSTPAPAAVAPPVQTPPRPEAANPAPVGRERAAERAQQATPDENRGHRAERPSAPPPPQVQTRVEPVRVAPAAVAPPAAVAVPAAAPVATPRPARVENRAPTEARPRQRDGKDDERGRRQERGDPHD
jgi:hypothetical protein